MKGLIDLFLQVRDRLRPTPAHAHYVFTLHELARVIQGILLMSPRSKIKPKRKSQSFTALLLHIYWYMYVQVQCRLHVFLCCV